MIKKEVRMSFVRNIIIIFARSKGVEEGRRKGEKV